MVRLGLWLLCLPLFPLFGLDSGRLRTCETTCGWLSNGLVIQGTKERSRKRSEAKRCVVLCLEVLEADTAKWAKEQTASCYRKIQVYFSVLTVPSTKEIVGFWCCRTAQRSMNCNQHWDRLLLDIECSCWEERMDVAAVALWSASQRWSHTWSLSWGTDFCRFSVQKCLTNVFFWPSLLWFQSAFHPKHPNISHVSSTDAWRTTRSATPGGG